MNDKLRALDHGPWLWSSKAALDRALSAGGFTGLAIYIGICRLESDAPKAVKDGFHASAINISHASGVNARTVKRYLPTLAQAGLFLMQSGKKAAASGAHEANRFRLLNIGSPCVSQSQACDFESTRDGTQKRTFSRREKECSSEEVKKGGSAAAPPAGAGSGVPAIKKTRACSGDAFRDS